MKLRSILLFTLLIPTLIGCQAFRAGYNRESALNCYLLVDESTDSLGYQRIEDNIYLDSSGKLKAFIDERGLPDFIYENSLNGQRDDIDLYYVKNNLLAEFVGSTDFGPDYKSLNALYKLTPGMLKVYKELMEEAGYGVQYSNNTSKLQQIMATSSASEADPSDKGEPIDVNSLSAEELEKLFE